MASIQSSGNRHAAELIDEMPGEEVVAEMEPKTDTARSFPGVADSSRVEPRAWDADAERRIAEAERRAAAFERRATESERRVTELERRCRDLERHAASQRRLLEVSEKLLLNLEPDAVLATLGGWLRGVVAYDSMSIHESRNGKLQPATFAADAYAQVVRDPGTTADRGLTAWVVSTGEALLVNDPTLDPRSQPDPRDGNGPHATIVAPLSVSDGVGGVICVSRFGNHARFTEREFELVKLLAGQASIALRNARAHREAADRAQRDSLTGLRNHGAFQAEVLELIGRGGPFALLMLDLDAFKTFNDAHGHPAGDVLLRSIARAMASATREADGIYRYGGDEFAVLLPGAARAQANVVVERIRSAVAGVDTGNGVRITVSAGIACFPDEGRTREDLVALADETLYETKRGAVAATAH